MPWQPFTVLSLPLTICTSEHTDRKLPSASSLHSLIRSIRTPRVYSSATAHIATPPPLPQTAEAVATASTRSEHDSWGATAVRVVYIYICRMTCAAMQCRYTLFVRSGLCAEGCVKVARQRRFFILFGWCKKSGFSSDIGMKFAEVKGNV